MQTIFSQGLGIPFDFSVGATSFTLAGAASPQQYVAFGFDAPSDLTLSKLRLYFGSNSGTPTDVRVSLYADDGTGKPVATGAMGGTESTGITITANAVNEFTWPANTTVAKGTRVHVAVKNYTAGASANLLYITNSIVHIGSHTTIGLIKYQTTTGDSGWGTAAYGTISGVLEATDGTKLGYIGNNAFASYSSNADRLFGTVFSIPDNVVVRATGISVVGYKNGAPTFNYRMKLFIEGNLVSEGPDIPGTLISTSARMVYSKITPVTIYPGQRCRIVIHCNGGDGTNYARTRYLSNLGVSDYDLKPLNASRTLSTDGGATWIDTASDIIPFWISGEVGTFFQPAPLNRRQFNSQR